MEPFWTSVREAALQQGDLLPGCWIPEYPAGFAEQTDTTRIIQADQADLIVITQTCDLEHGKVSLIALCPVWSIAAFEEAQASQGRGKSGKAWQDYWNNVRKGRSSTLHLLASPTAPTSPRAALLETGEGKGRSSLWHLMASKGPVEWGSHAHRMELEEF